MSSDISPLKLLTLLSKILIKKSSTHLTLKLINSSSSGVMLLVVVLLVLLLPYSYIHLILPEQDLLPILVKVELKDNFKD